MKGWWPLTLGLLAVVLGALWTEQGLGYARDSLLTGHRVWAVIGPAVALTGLAALWRGLRARRR